MGGFSLSLSHWPLGSHRPRALGIGVHKESKSVFPPDPEGPEGLEATLPSSKGLGSHPQSTSRSHPAAFP